MATFLDITGLQYFNSLFIFLFSWALVYAVFLLTKIFGGNKVLPVFVAFIVAILIIINPSIAGIIGNIAPWMGFVFVFIMLLLTSMKLLLPGLEEKTVAVRGGALLIIILVFVITILANMRSNIQEGGQTDFSKPVNVFLHPKLLGALLLLGIAMFTIALLTTPTGF